MLELFDFHGQTLADAAYVAALTFAIDLDEWVDSIDRSLVFLAKYGNLPPAWVEQQDLVRQNRLVRITIDFLRQQQPARDDTPPDWQ